MDSPRKQELSDIKDLLSRRRMTSYGRRQTVHYVERGKTAIGLVRSPGNNLRKPFLNKRASITPTPVRKNSLLTEERRRSSIFSRGRLLSMSDGNPLLSLPVTPSPVRRNSTFPASRRSSINLSVPVAFGARPISNRGSIKRRKSSAYGIVEEDDVFKVLLRDPICLVISSHYLSVR
ncbi:hypothetical protein ACF0H5_015093 [Mactra antiquata]